jgi:hypothetical protein
MEIVAAGASAAQFCLHSKVLVPVLNSGTMHN